VGQQLGPLSTGAFQLEQSGWAQSLDWRALMVVCLPVARLLHPEITPHSRSTTLHGVSSPPSAGVASSGGRWCIYTRPRAAWSSPRNPTAPRRHGWPAASRPPSRLSTASVAPRHSRRTWRGSPGAADREARHPDDGQREQIPPPKKHSFLAFDSVSTSHASTPSAPRVRPLHAWVDAGDGSAGFVDSGGAAPVDLTW
jgi:hypothetical protein